MCPNMNRADHVRQIVSARGLTLYRVSQKSAEIFGRSSRFYVPHNLYHDVADPRFAPTIQQMLALSHITNYRLSDWLAVFGLSPEMISRLQLMTPRRQTMILDSSVYELQAWIPWFADRLAASQAPTIAPLRQLLATSPWKRAGELLASRRRRFLYARVGREDVRAFPYLAAGSVVRVDPEPVEHLLGGERGNWEHRVFLVELSSGWTCSQIRVLAKDRVVLCAAHSPCIETQLRLGREARILGVVDAEIRPFVHHRDFTVVGSATLVKPRPFPELNPPSNLMELLRSARLRVGLSFREASSLSRWMAGTLSDKLYFAAASTLSDYETLATPPRHIQKILMLCVLYCISFPEFLRSSGLPVDREGRDPIPDELVPRRMMNERQGVDTRTRRESPEQENAFLHRLLEQWEEVPLFLRHSLNEITSLRNFSLSDVFWVGGERTPAHPLLENATLVAVNRRVKRPWPSLKDRACEQRLYIILKRDGSYLCSRCTLHGGQLVVHGHTDVPVGDQHFKNEIDAEVIGQVTAIVRRLTGSFTTLPF